MYMASDFHIISSEYISQHKYFSARKDVYETPTGKIVDPYFVVELPTSVCAMALTKSNHVLFVRQYRHPVGKEALELPGGFIDEHESPEIAIRRELQEETGYTFHDCHSLGMTAANPGVLNNYTHLFLLTGGEETSLQNLDDNEEIRVEPYTLEQARMMLEDGEIIQSMHALCMYRAFDKLKALQL